MADRDPQLGKWGIYDTETVQRIGLRRALEATATHLEIGIGQQPHQKAREEAVAELSRLRAQIRGMT